jgi:hypothetical protein
MLAEVDPRRALKVSELNLEWLFIEDLTITYPGFAWLIITSFGLEDWIYWRLLVQSLLITNNYRAILNLPTSQITKTRQVFSVFTSRILATDLYQSHCNYSIRQVFFSLANSVVLLCTASILILLLRSLLYSALCPLIIHRHGPNGKHFLKNARLLARYPATGVVLLRS